MTLSAPVPKRATGADMGQSAQPCKSLPAGPPAARTPAAADPNVFTSSPIDLPAEVTPSFHSGRASSAWL